MGPGSCYVEVKKLGCVARGKVHRENVVSGLCWGQVGRSDVWFQSPGWAEKAEWQVSALWEEGLCNVGAGDLEVPRGPRAGCGLQSPVLFQSPPFLTWSNRTPLFLPCPIWCPLKLTAPSAVSISSLNLEAVSKHPCVRL